MGCLGMNLVKIKYRQDLDAKTWKPSLRDPEEVLRERGVIPHVSGSRCYHVCPLHVSADVTQPHAEPSRLLGNIRQDNKLIVGAAVGRGWGPPWLSTGSAGLPGLSSGRRSCSASLQLCPAPSRCLDCSPAS